MMRGGVIFNGFIAFTRGGMNDDFNQRWKFMEKGVAYFLSDEMPLQNGQVAVHRDTHLTP